MEGSSRLSFVTQVSIAGQPSGVDRARAKIRVCSFNSLRYLAVPYHRPECFVKVTSLLSISSFDQFLCW